jgi:hypothetical protein
MNKFGDSSLPFLRVAIIFDAAFAVPHDENLEITNSRTLNIQARRSESLLKKNSGELCLFWTRQVMPHKFDKSSICS